MTCGRIKLKLNESLKKELKDEKKKVIISRTKSE